MNSMTLGNLTWSNMRSVYSGLLGETLRAPTYTSTLLFKKEKFLSYTVLKKFSAFFFKFTGLAIRYPRPTKFSAHRRIVLPIIVKHYTQISKIKYRIPNLRTLARVIWFKHYYYTRSAKRSESKLPRGPRARFSASKTIRVQNRARGFLHSTHVLRYDFYQYKFPLVASIERNLKLHTKIGQLTYLKNKTKKFLQKARFTLPAKHILGLAAHRTRLIRYFIALRRSGRRRDFETAKAHGFFWYYHALCRNASFHKFKPFSVFRLSFLVAHSYVQTMLLKTKMFSYVNNRNFSSYLLLQRFCKKLWLYRRRFVLVRAVRPFSSKFAFKLRSFISRFGLRLDYFIVKTFKVKKALFARLLINAGHVRVNGLIANNFKCVLERFDSVLLSKKALGWVKFLRARRRSKHSHLRRKRFRSRIRIWYKRSKAVPARWRGSPVVYSAQKRGAVFWDTRLTGLKMFMTSKTMGSLTLKHAQFLYKAKTLRW